MRINFRLLHHLQQSRFTCAVQSVDQTATKSPILKNKISDFKGINLLDSCSSVLSARRPAFTEGKGIRFLLPAEPALSSLKNVNLSISGFDAVRSNGWH